MKQLLITALCCLSLLLVSLGSATAADMTAEEKAYRDKIEFFDIDFYGTKNINPKALDVDVGINFKMRNNGNKEVYDMVVRARFLDADGEVITTKTIWPLGKTYNNMSGPFIPGQIWVGHVNPKVAGIINLRIIPKEAAKIKDYKLEIMELRLGETNPATGNPRPLTKDMTKEEAAYFGKIKLEDVVTKAKNIDNVWEGQLQIFCKIRNSGNKDASAYARVYLYDAKGNLIFVEDCYAGYAKAGTVKENDDDLQPMFSLRPLPANWDGKTVKVELLSVKFK